MSGSTWLVPLNVHHSLSLRTVAKNSRQLQNISTSIYALTSSLQSLEKSAFEIAGSTNKILSLLESKEHKESTIAAMRMLIFRHQQTCSEAVNEEDSLSAISSCIISEKLLNQEWFNLDLFSHASFEEMIKADEILRNCNNIIDSLRVKLSTEEAEMVDKLPDFLRRISEIENSSNNIEDSLLGLFNVNNVDLDDFAQNEIYDPKNSELKRYNMIQINGKGLNSFPNAMGIIKQLIDDEGVGKTLEKITFNDSEITRVSKEASNNPYLWGSEFDIRYYQKSFSNKASAARKLKMDIGKLKRRSSDSSKKSDKLVKEMNEAFKDRLIITGINVQSEKNEGNNIVEKISKKGFLNFLHYNQLSVNSENFHEKSVSDEDTLRFLLEDIDEEYWWTVALEGPGDEFVQWGYGNFEYWKDEEMILQLAMSKSEAIEKLFEEYLILD
jgi:hypothetical protein